MTSQWSFRELREAASKNFQKTFLPTMEDAQSAVDKHYPEVANIRATINTRLYDLRTKYGSVLPEELTAEEFQKRRTLKRAWENDFNLMKQRDQEQHDLRFIGMSILASPLSGLIDSYMTHRQQRRWPKDLATSSYKFEQL